MHYITIISKLTALLKQLKTKVDITEAKSAVGGWKNAAYIEIKKYF